jgi:hypothetical protein
MSTALPHTRQKYSAAVRDLRIRARAAEEANIPSLAMECREAIARLREVRGMKGRRRHP